MIISKVFVTVGTTKFDKLIQAVLSPKVINSLKKKGCRELRLQIGQGVIPLEGEVGEVNGVSISYYQFKDSLEEDIAWADLVISHGGAGCLLESLEAGKPTIAVINEDLMNNHQLEVASKLADSGYLLSATPPTLHTAIDNSDFSKLKRFPKRDPTLFAKSLDNFMGFSQCILNL